MSTLVLGIGGTGQNIILELKKILIENKINNNDESSSFKFFCLDTDYSIEKRMDPSDFFLLKVDKTKVPDLETGCPKIYKWFPSTLKKYIYPSPLNYGPIMDREVGRFAFAWNAEEIYQKLINLLSEDVDKVFICCSLSGLTGSGMFLDAAYMIRHIQTSLNRKFLICGLFPLSSYFDDPGIENKAKENCTESLNEIDYFMNKENYGNPERRFYPTYTESFNYDYSTSSNTPPFDQLYLFDKTNNTDYWAKTIYDFCQKSAKFIYTGNEEEILTNSKNVLNQ